VVTLSYIFFHFRDMKLLNQIIDFFCRNAGGSAEEIQNKNEFCAVAQTRLCVLHIRLSAAIGLTVVHWLRLR